MLDMYMRSITSGIDDVIDIYAIDLKTDNSVSYYIGTIDYSIPNDECFSMIYVNSSGIYEYYYGANLYIQHVPMKYIL